MSNIDLGPFATKLVRLGVSAEEQAVLLASVSMTRRCKAGAVIASQEEVVPHLVALLSGLAARFKLGPDGARQILAFCIPGDLCTVQVGVSERMDHGVMAISPCTFALVPRASVVALVEERPKLAMAFWRDTVADAAVEREWLFNLGRRNAYERIAHVLCEVHVRMESAGLATAASFDFPVTQSDLGDAMGISVVHVNRSIKALKQAGLIGIHRGRVGVLNRDGLTGIAGFDASYLGIETSEKPIVGRSGERNSSSASDVRA